MNLFTAAFNKIFKNGNQQVLDKIKPLIVEINNLSASNLFSPLRYLDLISKIRCNLFF